MIDCSKGLCLAPIRYKTANGSYHSTRRASEFTLLRRVHCQNPKSCFFLFQSLVFFFFQNLVLSSPSSTLPLIQKSDVVPSFTFIAPSRANGQAFFHWQGIETQSN
ncbi:hypothetical protein AVEN_253986-1 [Araneus ventricosus]|uniref:Uncharacterized protein n=1 Tax=Araneus ventricosus TaxID=182803 RepID=A0A4Y2GS28_ARAVE|nr:hypothetical protein AVEN_253986-1 [Araneus ventricosus]